ncbi:fimbrial protein [Klebsiella michiganensis]|uniref:fimbrial protein n=1 Tax=Klebsiella michiganensis TaxID=1134687 RepID=UPI002928E87B|nr:fimbrial protein [Klebsiella michiganensis]ELT1809873.1 fimbrial protein [Klebsiella michiganensis]MDV0341056.1 fimbrial protein [Klebsiella michiganensis]MDV0356812.1 fimbrial protein [Klebsiella michiganensis]MDV0404714.1 fimbrial protein [Klebsiella michiganensis]
MKLFTRLLLIFGITLAGWSSVAWGYTGWCTPVNGTQNYAYNFGTKNITDASQNIAGQTYPDAFSWSLGTTYGATCDCDPNDTTFSQPTYFTTVVNLPLGHNDGTSQFYKVNDYLEVSSKVLINGAVNTYISVPFENESNESMQTCSAFHSVTRPWGTGSKGKLSLYIAKPFVGTTTISSVKIFDLYGSVNTNSYGGSPIATVSISGQVIVPQTCSVNAGQIVTVDFGSFMSGEFKNKGQMPTGYMPKTITVPIKCNGMDANASLTLRFQAEASADEPAAIKTSNDDVGVQITDDSGKVIEPNSGLIPFQLDDNLQATVTFHAAPISTTGNAPAEGTFSSTAYIRVDFA